MQHYNAKFISAYAEGLALEYRDISVSLPEWRPYTLNRNSNWGPWCSCPHTWEWRITPKKVMIRHAVGSTGCVVCYLKNYNAYEDNATRDIEKSSSVKWLDDWHEASFGPEKV